jgi:hypothetical protein
MLRGFEIIDELTEGLEKILTDHKMSNLRELVGKALPYFSTHADLVERQRKAKVEKAGKTSRDDEWSHDKITAQTDALTTS